LRRCDEKKKKKTKSNNTERFAMFKLLGAKNRVISGFASVVAALQVVQLALGLDVEVKEDETVTRQALTDLQRFIICILLVGGEIRVKEIALPWLNQPSEQKAVFPNRPSDRTVRICAIRTPIYEEIAWKCTAIYRVC
jgi:hypothetical protein